MTVLLARGHRLVASPERPLVMGIVNANPDSFSDSVRLRTLDEQVEHALALVADGADVIDVGGESGVTYTDVSAEEVERRRVAPLVAALAERGVVVSVDTWKPSVAAAALEAGAAILNDVSGLRDPALADLAADAGAALVVMHTRGAPKQEVFPAYDDVVADVVDFLAERMEVALSRGVARDQLLLDPGPDFTKSPQESVDVLRGIPRVAALGRPWLAAVSRKYFVGAVTARAPGDRLSGTLAAVHWAADAGAFMVRVHDVSATRDLLAVRAVLRGDADVPDFDAVDDALKWIRADG